MNLILKSLLTLDELLRIPRSNVPANSIPHEDEVG